MEKKKPTRNNNQAEVKNTSHKPKPTISRADTQKPPSPKKEN